MSEKKCVYFPETKEYNGVVYSAGQTYEVEDKPKNFVKRWEKRGAQVLEKKEVKGKLLEDPRIAQAKEQEKKEEKKEVKDEAKVDSKDSSKNASKEASKEKSKEKIK